MNTQFLPVSGGSIAYDDTGSGPEAPGSGPLIICMPGMGDLRGEFRILAQQLVEAGYRVVTVDLRGHGESSVGWNDYHVPSFGADLLALARYLNSGPAILVGNSMAAGAAVWAAAQPDGQDWVRGLVLLGPATHGETSAVMNLMLSVLFARPWGPSAWLAYYRHLFTTRKPADLSAYGAQIQRNLSEPGRMEALLRLMKSLTPTPEAETWLARVHQPAVVIMGSKDPDFKDPRAEAAWLAERLHCAYHMVEGAGHYPQTEMPEITGPLVIDFLKTLEAGTPAREGTHAAASSR